jgi:hypothetical protein
LFRPPDGFKRRVNRFAAACPVSPSDRTECDDALHPTVRTVASTRRYPTPDGEWNVTTDLSAVGTHGRVSVTVTAAEGDAAERFEASLRDDGTASADEAPVSTPGFGVVAAVAAPLGSAAVIARTRDGSRRRPRPADP